MLQKILVLLALSFTAEAADWSDTSLSWRYGRTFREPFNGNKITKNIYSLSHVSGYAYGSNYFNVDLMQSNSKDAAAGTGNGAQEAYVVYRHTFDMGKIRGSAVELGPINGAGLVLGFDWNTKNDSYASKKRMLVAGPTVSWKLPAGYLNTAVLLLHESNAPAARPRKTYDLHPAVTMTWGVPVFELPFSFEGFAMWTAKKGKNEFGRETGAEFNLDTMIMWDVGRTFSMAPKKFRLGIEYQYWRNKFGNTMDQTRAAGGGSTASTPMIRAQYYF